MSAIGASWGRGVAKAKSNYAREPVTTSVAIAITIGALIYPIVDAVLGLNTIDAMIPIVIFILLALGLNIVVGFAGLLDLGYAAFFAIGAYTAAILTSARSPLLDQFPWLRLNFWWALLLAFFIAAIFGVLLGAPTLRLRGDYLAIVTLGFGEIVPVVFRNAERYTFGSRGMNQIDRPILFGLEFGNNSFRWYWLLIALGFLIVFMAIRLRDSRLGRAWMAMREDEIAAAAMGIDLVRTKLFAFALGASFSGLAGVMYAGRYSYADPSQFQFSTSVLLLSMVILGGLGNIWGVIIGGLLLGFFDRILADQLNEAINAATGIDLSRSRFLIFGLTLVLMMLLRPQGILPNERRRQELQGETAQGDAVVEETLYDSRAG